MYKNNSSSWTVIQTECNINHKVKIEKIPLDENTLTLAFLPSTHKQRHTPYSTSNIAMYSYVVDLLSWTALRFQHEREPYKRQWWVRLVECKLSWRTLGWKNIKNRIKSKKEVVVYIPNYVNLYIISYLDIRHIYFSILYT